MTDNGAAMVAEETTSGLAELGVLHQTTLPYSPYQYVALEDMWRRVAEASCSASSARSYAT
jgi:putative transposase